MFEGMAKPMPEPPATIAVLMPMTSPCMLTSGPPELPGLMAASVWMKSSNGPWPMLRALALTMPAVTVACRPNGEPTAMTQSPTCIRSESPSRANLNWPLPSSSLSTARSVFLSRPTTFALCLPPSSVMTSISVAFSTTCALVRAIPVASTITPEPRLRCGMRSGVSPKNRRKKSSPKNSSNGVRPPPPGRPPLETVLMLMTAGLMISATPAKLPVFSGICTGSTGAVGVMTGGATRSVRPPATAPRVTPATSITASAATNEDRLSCIMGVVPSLRRSSRRRRRDERLKEGTTPMMQLKRSSFVAALAVMLVAGVTLGAVAGGRTDRVAPPVMTPTAPVLPVQMPLNTGSFAGVAEIIKPAVININTVSKGGLPGGGGRTPFEEFFGEDFFRRFFGDTPERIPQRSLGSGVIVDATGIALTNAHVVEKATEIEVITLDGGKHKAKVVGLDKKTDLAVLKLDDGKGQFKFARLGDSDRMQVGDWVIAVGSPFGLQATVTAGIVSAKARNIGQGPFDDFIQTDAAINPGNSGGPLVNMQGEVIGINTAIVAGGSGIGFAIPSNMARKIYTEINSKGRVTRGWLGVSIQPLTQELARSFNAKDTKGVLISDVVPDSPAAKAGLKAGDILIEFDGKKVEAPADLQRTVGLAQPGHDAKMKVWRDQGEKTVDIKIGEAPDEKEVRQQPSGRATPSTLGLDVRPLTPEIARQLSLKSTDGVIVARVDEGSAAGEAGVQRGDVIREINRQKVRSLADYERLTKDVKEGDRLTVLLQRGQMSLYVAFTASARG